MYHPYLYRTTQTGQRATHLIVVTLMRFFG